MLDAKFSTTLINFDSSTQFIQNNVHIKNRKIKEFLGNKRYSSVNQMRRRSTSRKDDLVSLLFIFLTLMNRECFPILEDEKELKYNPYIKKKDTEREFDRRILFKNEYSLWTFSQKIPRMRLFDPNHSTP